VSARVSRKPSVSPRLLCPSIENMLALASVHGANRSLIKAGIESKKSHRRTASAPPLFNLNRSASAIREEMLADGSTRMTLDVPDKEDVQQQVPILQPTPNKHVRRVSAPPDTSELLVAPPVIEIRERLDRPAAPSPLSATASIDSGRMARGSISPVPDKGATGEASAKPTSAKARSRSPMSVFGGGTGALSKLRWWRKKPV